MVYEHEVPKGAKLYFAETARLKRHIESIASDLLYRNGFEEISTPFFSYHQHRYIEDERELIFIHDELNRRLSIRADSSIDVVRLITNRLGRSIEHKKWFYIQPIFRYPTKEINQIGAEVLDSLDISEIIKLLHQFFEKLKLKPILQLSNIKIPRLLAQNYGFNLEALKHLDIDTILKSEYSWIEQLLRLSKIEEIDELLPLLPDDIGEELLKIKEVGDALLYDNVVIAPLYYTKMRYYKDLFFRFFDRNDTLAMGGEYRANQTDACGFAIYTDTIIQRLKGS